MRNLHHRPRQRARSATAARITTVSVAYAVEGIPDRVFREGVSTYHETENHPIHGTVPQMIYRWGDHSGCEVITRQEAYATRARWEIAGAAIRVSVDRCACCTARGLV